MYRKKEKQFKTNAVADRSIQIIKQGQRGTKRNNLYDLYKTKYQRACELHYYTTLASHTESHTVPIRLSSNSVIDLSKFY